MHRFAHGITRFSVRRPWLVSVLMLLATLAVFLLALAPTILPGRFPGLHGLKLDTDPENMLAEDEPVRVFHQEMKSIFDLHDIMVLGMVNDVHHEGVFQPESLRRIYELTEFAKTLQWTEEGGRVGVIARDIIGPTTVDNVEQAGLGAITFEWLMPSPPDTPEEAVAVREKAGRLPFLDGTVVSKDGRAVCVYLPITSKDVSHRIYLRLREKILAMEGNERYFIAGLPVAEDTFGAEMFKQMAVSAPLAMLIIFLFMLFFFRSVAMVLVPMIVAVVSVIVTMGLLIITGNTVHIMSSMIPIFIMPIAVLDAIHILSEFFDRYRESGDRRATITGVMETLFAPMLYTSLTTIAGFASLALTPIPPVRTFGIFVALGVLNAWLWTVTFIPAAMMLIPAGALRKLERKGGASREGGDALLGRVLRKLGRVTYTRARWVLAGAVLMVCFAVYGISRIQINDNPIKWFKATHPIRVADTVLNRHFGGTYMAYLTLAHVDEDVLSDARVEAFTHRLLARRDALRNDVPHADAVFDMLHMEAGRMRDSAGSKRDYLARLAAFAEDRAAQARDDTLDAWDEAVLLLDEEKQRDEIFKQPEVLNYIAGLQDHLLRTGFVGKSNALPDIVKTIHREMLGGGEDAFRIPGSADAVAQCLVTFQNSHRPRDLWHFVTPDFKRTNLWIQLKSGDNRDMSTVVASVRAYMRANPPPVPLVHGWFGLTYINVVWQERMVSGMLNAFLGSFLIVLIMMVVLFRSFLWGILSMIPLTVTIGVIYGLIGLCGKDYDMPVAVLSSLSLGLAVDYAIHFLQRSRMLQQEHGDWRTALDAVFGEPARAIARNVIVVGLGFLPLLFAPLVPYRTVGFFIASILIVAGMSSLILLPALIRVLSRWLFPENQPDTKGDPS